MAYNKAPFITTFGTSQVLVDAHNLVNASFTALDDDITTLTSVGTAATKDTGTAAGNVPLNSDLNDGAFRSIGATNDTDIPDKGLLRTEYGLRKALPVQPTLSSDFTRNEHKVYEQYGLEPKTITQMYDVTRNGVATYWDATGILRTAGIDEPRINFDPVTGENLGLLVEEERTNLLVHSEDANFWTAEKAIVMTPNAAISPRGDMTATRVISSGLAAQEAMSIVGDTVYTFSAYLKSTDGSPQILRLLGDNGNSSEDITVSARWKRYEFTFTSSSGSNNRHALFGSTTGEEYDVLLWGYQLEQASYASSYIKTEGSQITRPADNVVRALGDEFNQEGFIVFVEATSFRADTSSNRDSPIIFSDNLNSFQKNKISIMYDRGSFNRVAIRIFGQGSEGELVIRFSSLVAEPSTNEFSRLAVIVKSGESAASINGGEVSFVDTIYTVNPIVERLQFRGSFSGFIKDVRILPLPNNFSPTDLRELTKP